MECLHSEDKAAPTGVLNQSEDVKTDLVSLYPGVSCHTPLPPPAEATVRSSYIKPCSAAATQIIVSCVITAVICEDTAVENPRTPVTFTVSVQCEEEEELSGKES